MDELRKELEQQVADLSNPEPPSVCYTCIALAIAAGITLSHILIKLIDRAYF